MKTVIYKHDWERARRSEVIRKQHFQTVLTEQCAAGHCLPQREWNLFSRFKKFAHIFAYAHWGRG